MAMVKGAGSEATGENPHVTSKANRDHGMPRSPGKVTHPDGIAKPTGSGHAGFSEHGHMHPTEVAYRGSDKHK